jgi:hypothetical protein
VFDVIHLKSTEPLYLSFVFSEDPDLGGNLTTLVPIEGETPRRIARQPATTEAAAYIAGVLVHEPRIIIYQGTEGEPGLVAMVYAVVKAAEVNAEDAAWKPDEESGLYLGTVVRYRHDMLRARCELCLGYPCSHPRELAPLTDQCNDHFKAILGGKTVEPVDKALEVLVRGQPDAPG